MTERMHESTCNGLCSKLCGEGRGQWKGNERDALPSYKMLIHMDGLLVTLCHAMILLGGQETIDGLPIAWVHLFFDFFSSEPAKVLDT